MEILSALVVLTVVGALLLLALTPETAKDALVYHLAIPKLYLRHGGIYFIEGNIAQGNPLLTEMIFLLALFLKGDSLAKLLVLGVLTCTSGWGGAPWTISSSPGTSVCTPQWAAKGSTASSARSFSF